MRGPLDVKVARSVFSKTDISTPHTFTGHAKSRMSIFSRSLWSREEGLSPSIIPSLSLRFQVRPLSIS